MCRVATLARPRPCQTIELEQGWPATGHPIAGIDLGLAQLPHQIVSKPVEALLVQHEVTVVEFEDGNAQQGIAENLVWQTAADHEVHVVRKIPAEKCNRTVVFRRTGALVLVEEDHVAHVRLDMGVDEIDEGGEASLEISTLRGQSLNECMVDALECGIQRGQKAKGRLVRCRRGNPEGTCGTG